MKKLYFILIITLISVIGIAQPAIDSTYFTAPIGEKIIIKRAPFNEAINIGSNVLWDFSNLIYTDIDTIVISNLESLCNGEYLPGGYMDGAYDKSNIHFYKESTKSVDNYQNTNTGLYYEGGGRCNYYRDVYLVMEKLIEFPFSYDSKFTTSYSGTITNGFPIPYFSGSTIVIADGYGNLILPNITFSNVLKLKSNNTHIYGNNPPTTETYHSWYSEGIPYPILKITSNSAYYIDKIIIGISNEMEQSNFIEIYPNPVKDDLTIDIKYKVNNISYCIFDITGKKITENTLLHNTIKFNVNTKSYPQGIYFIRISMDNKVITKKIVKL